MSYDLSLPLHFNISLSWQNVLVCVLWCVQPLTLVSSPGLFTEAVCGEGGGIIVEHSDTESKMWNSTSTSSTQMIHDIYHYSVSVILDIPYTLYLSCIVRRMVFMAWISVAMYLHMPFLVIRHGMALPDSKRNQRRPNLRCTLSMCCSLPVVMTTPIAHLSAVP